MNDTKFIFRGHAVVQMFKREISVSDVKFVLTHGNKIKEYSEDKPFPSFVMLGFINGKPIHVVASTDMDMNCYIITAYVPDKKLWNNDFTKKQ